MGVGGGVGGRVGRGVGARGAESTQQLGERNEAVGVAVETCMQSLELLCARTRHLESVLGIAGACGSECTQV